MRSILLRCVFLACFAGAAGLWAGCKTVRVIEEEPPLAETVLMVARTSEGMHLQWASRTGFVYTVLYADRRDGKARWQPLPGAVRLMGTGQPITLRDRIAASQPRYYRLQVLPVAGSSP